MKSPGLNFDLMEQLSFYGSYHSRPGNQAIHFVFVPLIHWTITVWLAYAPLPTAFDLPAHLDFLPEWLSRYACTACTSQTIGLWSAQLHTCVPFFTSPM